VDPVHGIVDPVHGIVDLFHAFFNRKIILKISKIVGALEFYKNTPELF
jgi:hypothetical protein